MPIPATRGKYAGGLVLVSTARFRAEARGVTPAGVKAISQGLSQRHPRITRALFGYDPGRGRSRSAFMYDVSISTRIRFKNQCVFWRAHCWHPCRGANGFFYHFRGYRFAQPPANRCDPCRGQVRYCRTCCRIACKLAACSNNISTCPTRPARAGRRLRRVAGTTRPERTSLRARPARRNAPRRTPPPSMPPTGPASSARPANSPASESPRAISPHRRLMNDRPPETVPFRATAIRRAAAGSGAQGRGAPPLLPRGVATLPAKARLPELMFPMPRCSRLLAA